VGIVVDHEKVVLLLGTPIDRDAIDRVKQVPLGFD
jgi:hypothetical protein